MHKTDALQKQQIRLRHNITAMLDSFLIGTVARSPSMTGHNLTTKVKGKTTTLYVRRDIVPMALEMSRRYRKLRIAVQKLSNVNWKLLKLRNNK